MVTSNKNQIIYEDFPTHVVIFRLSHFSFIVLSSTIILFMVIQWMTIIYLLYVSIIFLGIFKFICSKCDYHGKTCDTGLSKFAGILFTKNTNRNQFRTCGIISLPFLGIIFLIPIIIGVFGIIKDHSSFLLINLTLFIFLLIVYFLITPKLSCSHCKMNDVCPLNLKKC